MKRALIAALFALTAPLVLRPQPVRPLALVPSKPDVPAERRAALPPVPFLWRELNAQRVNEGILGRKNATRDEQRVAETPSLQPRPLSSW